MLHLTWKWTTFMGDLSTRSRHKQQQGALRLLSENTTMLCFCWNLGNCGQIRVWSDVLITQFQLCSSSDPEQTCMVIITYIWLIIKVFKFRSNKLQDRRVGGYCQLWHCLHEHGFTIISICVWQLSAKLPVTWKLRERTPKRCFLWAQPLWEEAKKKY